MNRFTSERKKKIDHRTGKSSLKNLSIVQCKIDKSGWYIKSTYMRNQRTGLFSSKHNQNQSIQHTHVQSNRHPLNVHHTITYKTRWTHHVNEIPCAPETNDLSPPHTYVNIESPVEFTKRNRDYWTVVQLRVLTRKEILLEKVIFQKTKHIQIHSINNDKTECNNYTFVN